MPPPVTPSPHRFVIKKEVKPQTAPGAQQCKPQSSTHQFNAAPRFSIASTPRSTAMQNHASSALAGSRYVTPGRNIQVNHDFIDVSSSDDHIRSVIHESIELGAQDKELDATSGPLGEDFALDEPKPKRRRLSSSPFEENNPESKANENHASSITSSVQLLSSPPAPRRAITIAASRFITIAPMSTPTTPVAPQSTFRKPPPFRPPDPSERPSPQKDPLPDQFSPQKGGRKYVQGGMAKELQGWLVSMESALPSQHSRSDYWLARLVIGEVSGGGRGGPTMIKGRQIGNEVPDEHNSDVKIILAGEGTITGLQRCPKVEVGKTVGVNGPVWEIVLEGERWGVGVDWKILPSYSRDGNMAPASSLELISQD